LSVQHELLHGHPTRWTSLNKVLGYAPFAVWYPYTLYRDSHLLHHRDEDLVVGFFVEILSFNERGPVLAVRPYCNTAHYWQVYFDTNRTIRETFGAAGYPAAEAHMHIRHKAA
jgi:fatty acid desaturase